MKAILLIGGFGTRLRPLTLTRPKALLPVANRPFLAYQLELLREAGVSDVMLACGNFMLPFKRAFNAIAPRGTKLHFAFEPAPLGTGGAIRFAHDRLKSAVAMDRSPILVFNGDVFFELPVKKFVAFHLTKKAAATIALTRVEDPSRFGLVELEKGGRVKRFLEKSKSPFRTDSINAGAYVFSPSTIESMPPGRPFSVEREFFPALLRRKEAVYGFPMKGYWNDIGTHASYMDAHRVLLTTKNRWTRARFFRKRSRLKTTPAGKSFSFEGFVSCGDDVSIGKNCRVENSILMDGCRLEQDAVVSGAVLGRKCRIGHHAVVRPGSVLADGTEVLPYSKC